MRTTPDKGQQTRLGASHVPLACDDDCRFFREECQSQEGRPEGPLLKVSRGTTIYSHEQPAHFCYRLIEGAVRLYRVLPDGRRQILEICLPSETFGLETSDTYSATAEAIGEVIVLRCPRACIAELQDERPETRQAMLSMLSRGMCAAQDHVAMLGHQNARERVACYLLRLALGHEERPCVITLPMGRQDMADYLGLTIETTCRSLSDLKAARIITTPDRHRILIHNMEKLEAVAARS
ncbi:MAG: helix-turn-helix domain-containing protein [Alphaproteobacteria bacterium]|nr:helix-turn-helix domain-containing protein [Alphaproteobacteria bacterium]